MPRQQQQQVVVTEQEQELRAAVPASTGAPSRGGRRGAMLGLAAAAASAALVFGGGGAAVVAPPPAAAADSYLLSTGGHGIIAEEEAKLLQLRQELEAQVRKEIEAERAALEAQALASQGGGGAPATLCATPFGIDVVGITEFVALVGALVGGITARQRKAELERLNEQLRRVNLGLRQQARAGMVYAPGLTYVPPANEGDNGNGNGNGSAATAVLTAPPPTAAAAAAAAPTAVAVATVTAPPKPAVLERADSARTLFSMDEDEMTADQIACRDSLRQGKRLLKDKSGAAALVRFEKALMLSKAIGDPVQERRAMRGLAAAARLQGQYKAAIKHLERVLEISKEMREFTGDADAVSAAAAGAFCALPYVCFFCRVALGS